MKEICVSVCLAALATVLVGCPGGGEETCGDCAEEKCADLIDICEKDEGCACMVTCVGEEGIGGVDGCFTSCGLDSYPANYAQVESCVATACPDGDECSVPAGYEPPDEEQDSGSSTLDDIGGGDLADCEFDADLDFDPEGAILQLENTDEDVCVRIVRVNKGAGSLANTEWEITEMAVGPLGRVAHVVKPGDLCWYSSHHNFTDWAHAWTGSRRHDLNVEESGHDDARVYTLFTFEEGSVDPDACAPEADGSLLIGEPIVLTPYEP